MTCRIWRKSLCITTFPKTCRAGGSESFRARSVDNPRNRCLHQHVFNTYATIAMLDQAGVQLQQVEAIRPYHIVAVGRTPSTGQAPDNRPILAASAPWRHRSPFPSDQDRDTNSAALRGVAACRKGIRNSCR